MAYAEWPNYVIIDGKKKTYRKRENPVKIKHRIFVAQ